MEQDNIYGNRGKAVSADVIDTVDHSLMLIKVDRYNIYKRECDNQLRMEFEYYFNSYDLPITDIVFVERYNDDNGLLENIDSIYLTISLGVYHNGWHSKLIAGVLYCK